MNPLSALAVALSAGAVAAFALTGAPSAALAAPAAKQTAPHHQAAKETPESTEDQAEEPTAASRDGVAMAEAGQACDADPTCRAAPPTLADAARCLDSGGVPGAGGCVAAPVPPPTARPQPRPTGAATLSSALSSFLVGPVPVKVVGAILSQPAVSDRLWRAACGLVHHCPDAQATDAQAADDQPKK